MVPFRVHAAELIAKIDNDGEVMNRYVMMPILLFVACFLQVSNGMAAQSSADVTVTPELLEEVRLKIMGEPSGNIDQDDEYVIGRGDLLYIGIYGEGSMAATAGGGTNDGSVVVKKSGKASESIKVRIDGRISLSHIGDVEVVGMTLTQLADYLKELFQTTFDDPIVTTVLIQSSSRRYTVMGKVVQPGIFLIDFPVTLVQAVARCGGFTEWANSDITVVRQKPGKGDEKLFEKNTMEFDYDDFLDGEDLERNIYIQPDDTIIIH